MCVISEMSRWSERSDAPPEFSGDPMHPTGVACMQCTFLTVYKSIWCMPKHAKENISSPQRLCEQNGCSGHVNISPHVCTGDHIVDIMPNGVFLWVAHSKNKGAFRSTCQSKARISPVLKGDQSHKIFCEAEWQYLCVSGQVVHSLEARPRDRFLYVEVEETKVVSGLLSLSCFAS